MFSMISSINFFLTRAPIILGPMLVVLSLGARRLCDHCHHSQACESESPAAATPRLNERDKALIQNNTGTVQKHCIRLLLVRCRIIYFTIESSTQSMISCVFVYFYVLLRFPSSILPFHRVKWTDARVLNHRETPPSTREIRNFHVA